MFILNAFKQPLTNIEKSKAHNSEKKNLHSYQKSSSLKDLTLSEKAKMPAKLSFLKI